MAFIADVARMGIIPFQEHQEDWGSSEFQSKNTVNTRGLPQGGRVVYSDEFAGPVIEPETRGPWIGGFLWESPDTATHPHIWSVAMPVVSSTPPKGCPTPGGLTQERGRELQGKGSLQRWRPVLGPTWTDEQTDLAQVSLVTPNFRVLPGRFPGIALDSVDTGTQHDLVLPAGHMLVAPHKNGDGNEGTPVYELDGERNLDELNFASLQSFMRVWRRDQKAFTPCQAPSSLAWQISSALPGVPGNGMVAQGPKGKQNLGASTDELGGPFHTVPDGDQHVFSSSKDGEAIAPLHLSTKTIFHGNGGDAPIEFGPEYIPVSPGPLLSEAYLRYDSEADHDWALGSGKGLWRFQGTSFFAIIQKYPPLPPPFPPEVIPPTSGGGGGVVVGGGGGLFGPELPVDGFIIPRPPLNPSQPPNPLDPTGEFSSRASRNEQRRSAGSRPPRPPQPPRVGSSAPRDATLIGTPNEIAVPALTFRAQNFCEGALDLRNMDGATFQQWGDGPMCEFFAQPAVARLESIAMESKATKTGFVKTTENSFGRFGEIGTACGGVWVMRPEQGIESLTNAPTNLSKTYFGTCGTEFAAGTPDRTSGAFTSGFSWGLNADSQLAWNYRNDGGSETTDMALITSRGTIQTQAGYEISGYNDTGSAIADGKVVTVPSAGGVNGLMPNIDVVGATTDTPIGIVVGEISNGSSGTILTRGAIDGITISGSPSVGDPVYFDASGDLTFTEPFAGATPIGQWWG